MMQQQRLAAILLVKIIIVNRLALGAVEELLELSCTSAEDCRQFAFGGTESICFHGNCVCTELDGSTKPCRPAPHKQSNIIGGYCPCMMPFSYCYSSLDVCYCLPDYMSSRDKRRCVKRTLMLDEDCDTDAQCQTSDSFAVCKALPLPNKRFCACRNDFLKYAGKCVLALGNEDLVTCRNDTICEETYGAHAQCVVEANVCICGAGFVPNEARSACVASELSDRRCTEHVQCQLKMGYHAQCVNQQCQCQEDFLLFETTHATPEYNETKLKCQPKVVIGQYCMHDDECYQHQLAKDQQSMLCDHSECNCRYGYRTRNKVNCTAESAGDLSQPPSYLWYAMFMVLLLQKTFTCSFVHL